MDIYVDHLASDITGRDLREAFEVFGRVASADVMKHWQGRGIGGFEFVVMPSRGRAIFAIGGAMARN
jgi:hypothetical protein